MNFIPKIEYTEIGTGLAKSITFDSPPEGDPFNEEISVSNVVTTSNNGNKQTQFNYSEQKFKIDFTFQSETTKDAVKDMLLNHTFKGGTINYFDSSDELAFNTFYITDKKLKLDRPIPVGDFSGQFEYDFSLSMSSVL